MRQISAALMSFLLIAPAHAGSARAALPIADAVFLNGEIFTADAGDSVRQALALKDGRFLAVGDDREIRAYVGPKTRVVDLKGRFVSPGLADGHFHNEGGGQGLDLSHARSLRELLIAVANAAAGTGAGELLVSNMDWHEAQLKEQRLPTAEELSLAAPDNPVVLVRGGHSYILNNAALAKWNITPDTPVPAGGQISRDASGVLTGEITDKARSLVALPPEEPVSMADLLRTQKILNSYGITAARIPGAYRGNLLDAYHLMREADAKGQLTVRYVVYLPGFGLRSADAARRLIADWGVRPDEGDDWLRIGGVKLLVDGGFEGGHLREPYQEPYGKGGTYSGLTTVPQEPLNEVVATLDEMGWRPATHAVGDAAVDEVLKAYAAADARIPIGGKRWAIEHAFVVDAGQLSEMKRLDIALSAQDHLYLAAPVLKKYWGAERAEEVTPLKSCLEAGLLVAGGTDSPVIPVNPFWELYHFASRDTISGGVYGADQRIASRSLLLRLITINYAKLIGEDTVKGSIEAGKLADFAVLSGDFLTIPVENIPSLKAAATYVAGREVYRDYALWPSAFR